MRGNFLSIKVECCSNCLNVFKASSKFCHLSNKFAAIPYYYILFHRIKDHSVYGSKTFLDFYSSLSDYTTNNLTTNHSFNFFFLIFLIIFKMKS